jgi:hypothetical protein
MFNVDLKPEDVDRFVKEALLKSTLGETITTTFNANFNKILSGWDSPVDKLLKEIIAERFREFLNQPENKLKIAEATAKVLTDEYLNKVISYAVEKTKEYMADR